MKLRNKKTGEIGYLIVGRGSDYYHVCNDEWSSCGKYWSLAELNEEWEDAPEEPKEYWTIDWTCIGVCVNKYSGDDVDEFNKQIGNYFETKEEAEKAVEKLKALKRLKDKGFMFIGKTYETDKRFGSIFYKVDDDTYSEDIIHELDLLFGGEE